MRRALLWLLPLAIGCGGVATGVDATGSNEAALGSGNAPTMQIPLVVVLWEDVNYGGRKRQFVADMGYIGNGYLHYPVNCQCSASSACSCIPSGPADGSVPGADFNDVASAVGVHPGPDYDAFIASHGYEPTVTLWTDENYKGVSVRLAAGAYPDLRVFGINDAITSVQLDDDATTQALPIRRSSTPAATFWSIPRVVLLHSASLERRKEWLEADNVLTVVEASSDLGADYGFNDSVSSVEVMPGSSSLAAVVRLFADAGYGGASLSTSLMGDWPVSDLGFNDVASSLKITPIVPINHL